MNHETPFSNRNLFSTMITVYVLWFVGKLNASLLLLLLLLFVAEQLHLTADCGMIIHCYWLIHSECIHTIYRPWLLFAIHY